MTELLAGLAHLHAATGTAGTPLGLVHRDVTPANVFLAKDGRVKLSDLGVARLTGLERHSLSRQVKGKLRYLSPEQVVADPVGPETDVFAAGAILFELLAGRFAFDQDTEHAVMVAIRDGKVPRLARLRPELPKDLSAVVARALHRKPRRRFPTAHAFRDALDAVVFAHGLQLMGEELAEAASAWVRGSASSRSPGLVALGVPHGFSLRAGGVSQGPYESLNLGAAVGDDPAAVAGNLARLAAAGGVAGFLQASQVHGTTVHQVAPDADPEALRHLEADALVTTTPGRAVGVRTADCVPLLFAGPGGAVVAAAHAGWRGTIGGIARETVTWLQRACGVAPATLRVAIGPCIRTGCYEVDPELGARFVGALGDGVTWTPEGAERPRLDLVEANLRVLEAAGVGRDQVDIVGGCTHCDPARYFSHRRDRGVTGRHLSFVAPAHRGDSR